MFQIFRYGFIIASSIIFFQLESFSQGGGSAGTLSPVALEKVIPPTPEAASLGKYGNFPVGLFTGTINVNIDLYKLTARQVSLPVSINYSSNGLRVDDMPTKVGMTWTLLAGGAITRTIYGRPDDTYPRAPAPPSTDFSSHTSTDLSLPAWLENIDFNHQDTQLDEFNYSFGGYSGKFILGPNNVPVSIPYSNLKIEFTPQIRITTPDGIQYYFGEDGATESSLTGSGSCSVEDKRGAKTAWYLTRIVNSNDPTDNIQLKYTQGAYNYIANQSETITFWDPTNSCTGVGGPTDPCGCGPSPCIYGGPGSPSLAVDNFCSNMQIVSTPYISSITSSTFGKIIFNYTTSPGQYPIPIDRMLQSIQIFQNNDGTILLKTFTFDYTLTLPTSSGKITSLDNRGSATPDVHMSRPFLTKLQELDATGKGIKTHSFEYNDINHLTARLSSSQDYWGYYNGKSNPTSFIPGVDANIPITKVADRNPDYTYASKGILTKVNFPTGGNIQFVYEGNSAMQVIPTTTPANILSLAYAGGGMRVKQQIAYDQVSQQSTKTNYAYSAPTIPYSPLYVNNISYKRQKYLWFDDGQGIHCEQSPRPCTPLSACNYLQYSSNSTINTSGRGGSPVYYTSVTESVGDDFIVGGTEHTFTHFPDENLNVLRGDFIANSSAPSATWKNGLETNRNIFKMVDGNKVYLQKIVNTYVDDPGINNVYTQYITKKSGVSETITTSPGGCTASPVFNLRMDVFDVVTFNTTQKWTYLSSRQQTDYDQNGANPMVVTTNYFYDNPSHTQLTRTQTTGSMGETLVETNRYPGDESNISSLSSSELDAIGKLETQHRINTLLEKETTNNSATVSKVRTGFKDWGANFIMPETKKFQVGPNPMETRINYNLFDSKGNILEQQKTSDVTHSFIWGYQNKYPIAEAINAANNFHLVASPFTVTNTINLQTGQTGQQQITFTTYYTGSIVVTIQSGSWLGTNGRMLSGQVSLIGPSSPGGNVCNANPSSSCTSQPSITFPNMPPGNYVLHFDPFTNNIGTGNTASINVSFQGIQYTPTGVTEIYYEGFEELSGTVAGLAHSGTHYWNGSFPVPFNIPNSRTYLIQWWSYSGSWIFHQQTYSNGMTLSGTIDDVRVFPEDAQLVSYAYSPLVGMTSQTDAAGKTIFYEYDNFQRLKNIKDDQGNIVKNYQYNYGSNCTQCPIRMRTLGGTNTLSYPVGVFNVNGKLLGNAASQSAYITLWNSDAANQNNGVLSAGADSMNFILAPVNQNVILNSVTGCRYYQYDLDYTNIDGVRNYNASYIDFGDGTGMRMGVTQEDTVGIVIPANTVRHYFSTSNIPYYIHTYPDNSLKTITFYHSESQVPTFDNFANPATSLTKLKNARGNFPQFMYQFVLSNFQQASTNTIDQIINWNSISTINTLNFHMGDGTSNPVINTHFAQNFLQNQKLTNITITQGDFYANSLRDTSFKLTRVKSDWNTYFTDLQRLIISEDQWNHEDLSALVNLNNVYIIATNQNHSNDPTSNPIISIPSSVVDSIIIQVARGAGQNVSNGFLTIRPSGPTRTSASDAALNLLISKGWQVIIDKTTWRSVPMQTFAGTNTLGYPVGVFNYAGKFLGNASTASQYVTIWNSDSANQVAATLTVGSDSMHFVTIVPQFGRDLTSVIGCRYYQYDLSFTQIDGIRNINGAFVDFGDGSRMKLGTFDSDTAGLILASNTIMNQHPGGWPNFLHTYPDTSLKTITLYHNDGTAEYPSLDNALNPATSLSKVKNFRGTLPQFMAKLGGSCYQEATATTVANISNWSTINTVTTFNMNPGDGGATPIKNVSYEQDFMSLNRNLQNIFTAYGVDGVSDSTFKISRLKSDWNSYFTLLAQLIFNDDNWDRESLSSLLYLNNIKIYPSIKNPGAAIPSAVIDGVINQISAGAGQTVTNGHIILISRGGLRTTSSDAAVAILKSNGWTIIVNGVTQ